MFLFGPSYPVILYAGIPSRECRTVQLKFSWPRSECKFTHMWTLIHLCIKETAYICSDINSSTCISCISITDKKIKYQATHGFFVKQTSFSWKPTVVIKHFHVGYGNMKLNVLDWVKNLSLVSFSPATCVYYHKISQIHFHEAELQFCYHG